MTVFIRHATKPPEDEVSPCSPTLAMLVRLMEQRGGMMCGEPLTVNANSYSAAEAEMTTLYRKRGYEQIARAQLAEPNFLLFGVPVVAETDE